MHEALKKQYKNKITSYEKQIQKMDKEKRNQYRSQQSLQMNYYFKKFQMFTAMHKLISNLKENERSQEDRLVFNICTKLFKEEELCLRYSAEY